jgi:Holliday junction resolvase RusA-like endonuclease
MTAPVLFLVVHGRPAPQGSKRAVINRYTGRAAVVEQVKSVGPWRDAVRAEAVEARKAFAVGTLECPVIADMVFSFTRPKNHYRSGRNAHLLRDDAPRRPPTPPDLSKLARSTEDALTDAAVWRDDSLVVEYGRLAKVFIGEDRDSLDSPGVLIRIWRVEDLTPPPTVRPALLEVTP